MRYTVGYFFFWYIFKKCTGSIWLCKRAPHCSLVGQRH